MFRAYIVIRWMIFLFIITPLIYFIPMSVVLEYIVNFGFSENYIYLGLPIIYIFTIRYLWREEYDYSRLDSLSSKFKNAVLLIYSSIILTLCIFGIVTKIVVLAFFAGPFILLTFVMLVYGCDSARNELKASGVLK